MTLRTALAALLLVLAVGCNGDGDGVVTPQPQPAQSDQAGGGDGGKGGEGDSSEPSGAAQEDGQDDGNTITANPAAELEGSCKQRPREGDDGQELVARLRVVNTGNLGVVVRVSSQWRLGNEDGISRWTRVRVEQGETLPVNLRLPVSESVAQDALDAADNGRRCSTRSRVTGAFGMPTDS